MSCAPACAKAPLVALSAGVEAGSVVAVCLDVSAQPTLGEELKPQPRHALASHQQTSVGAIAPVLVAPRGLSRRSNEEVRRSDERIGARNGCRNRRLQRGPLPLQRQTRVLPRRIGAALCDLGGRGWGGAGQSLGAIAWRSPCQF